MYESHEEPTPILKKERKKKIVTSVRSIASFIDSKIPLSMALISHDQDTRFDKHLGHLGFTVISFKAP